MDVNPMDIFKYRQTDEDAVLSAIKMDPDWDMFTRADTIDTYRKCLKKGVTYVSYDNEIFCGYVRSILDEGFAIYISELFVVPEWRNKKIGRSLIKRVKEDFSHLTVYALSDEDAYYEKLDHQKVGSVFEIQS